ncbi:MAG: hypothetical protein FJW80_03215 [Actinobacteria bacterium]|nr:hypothetical protein [Actinomycetota bacterium]
MTWYSEIPARRTRQIAGDIWLLAWSALWIWAALRVYDLVMNLAAPGLAVADGATDLAGRFTSAGDAVGGVPFIGDALQSPFDGMAGASESIAAAGQTAADAVGMLARFLAIALAVLGIASWAMLWVPIRVAFIRRATAAKRFLDSTEDLDLFALRAMARQPLHLLAKISDDPAGAWRRGDQRVIGELAALELRSEGLRPLPAGR